MKKLYITLTILSIVFLGIGGTLAAITYTANAVNITQIKSGNLTMTIDGGGNQSVSLFPSSCTSEHAIKRTITAKTVNTSGGKVSFSIGLTPTVLDYDLETKTMRYALTTSPTSCTDGLLASGSFEGKQAGSDFWLIKNDYDNITVSGTTYTKTYYLYIWLDEIETRNRSGDIAIEVKGSTSNNPDLETIAEKKVMLYHQIKDNADTTMQIDFSKTSEETNTNGIYTTTENNIPVYYYRGAVENNVLFADYCWKIVRTTETGGVKLIYNGESSVDYDTHTQLILSEYVLRDLPDGINALIFDSSTKSWKNSADGAYAIIFSPSKSGNYSININMTNAVYDALRIVKSSVNRDYLNGDFDIVYEDYEYSGVSEKLAKIINLGDLTTEDVIVIVVQGLTGDVGFSMVENSGNIVSGGCYGLSNSIATSAYNSGYDSIEGLTYTVNKRDSEVKAIIDNWYYDNLYNGYRRYLEDPGWCNDTFSGSREGNEIYYGAYDRLISNKIPTLECQDSFSLQYPIAMLTADETVYAGAVYKKDNNSFYLSDGSDIKYWTLSPSYFDGYANLFAIGRFGLIDAQVNSNFGVRPAISLQPGIDFISGNGSETAPYIIDAPYEEISD